MAAPPTAPATRGCASDGLCLRAVHANRDRPVRIGLSSPGAPGPGSRPPPRTGDVPSQSATRVAGSVVGPLAADEHDLVAPAHTVDVGHVDRDLVHRHPPDQRGPAGPGRGRGARWPAPGAARRRSRPERWPPGSGASPSRCGRSRPTPRWPGRGPGPPGTSRPAAGRRSPIATSGPGRQAVDGDPRTHQVEGRIVPAQHPGAVGGVHDGRPVARSTPDRPPPGGRPPAARRWRPPRRPTGRRRRRSG